MADHTGEIYWSSTSRLKARVGNWCGCEFALQSGRPQEFISRIIDFVKITHPMNPHLPPIRVAICDIFPKASHEVLDVVRVSNYELPASAAVAVSVLSITTKYSMVFDEEKKEAYALASELLTGSQWAEEELV